MVTLGKGDLQTTPEGFMKIYDDFRSKGITIQEAYYRTVAHCEKIEVLPNYATLESFKTNVLYKK